MRRITYVWDAVEERREGFRLNIRSSLTSGYSWVFVIIGLVVTLVTLSQHRSCTPFYLLSGRGDEIANR